MDKSEIDEKLDVDESGPEKYFENTSIAKEDLDELNKLIADNEQKQFHLSLLENAYLAEKALSQFNEAIKNRYQLNQGDGFDRITGKIIRKEN